jgi:hypothetical protein
MFDYMQFFSGCLAEITLVNIYLEANWSKFNHMKLHLFTQFS